MATSNTGVIIKRSLVTAIPPFLESGEIAYSYLSNTFFIGSPTSDGTLNVGGQLYTQTIDAATPNAVANTLVKRDANGQFYGAVLNNINGLTPGYYGGQTDIPVIQVSANGLITSISNTAVPQPDTANLVNGIYRLSLGSDGKLTFPDNTLQNTAFTGTAIDQVARDLANNSSSGSAVDQYARDTANSSITGSAIDQFARNRANTDVTNVSLVGSSVGSSTQIPVITYAANGRITSVGVTSPQIGTGSVRGVVQLNDSITSTSGSSGANAATPLAVKSAYDHAQVSFDHANTTNILAQAAFDKANTGVSTSSDQYARDTANTAASNTVILQGINNTQNTDISVLYGVNLTQNNNITVIQGVNVTQNSRITSVENLVGSSYTHANAAFNQANVGATFVNTGGTVSGNVSFAENVIVSGNLNVLGTATTIDVSEIIVGDPLLYLGANNYTSDAVDIGIIGNYNDGINAHTGIFRDPNLKEWIFFKGYTPEVQSNNLIDLNHSSFRYANVYASYFKGNLIGSSAVVNGLDLYDYATSSFSKANTVGTLAQAGFDTANTALTNSVYNQGVDLTQNNNILAIDTYASGAYDKANSSNTLAQAAFDKANTAGNASIDQYARDTANTAASNTVILQGVNDTQNTDITAVNTFTSGAYDKANLANALAQSAFDKANTDVTNISIPGSTVGSSTQIPVIGYAANGRIISAGVASPQTATGSVKGVVELSDSISSTLGVSGANAATPLAVKTTFDFAQASFNTANTASSNTVYTQGVNDTQNTNISATNTLASSSYDKANSANVLAQSAFDTANSAAANTIYTQGVNDTQNTNISHVNTFAGSAYDKANSANVLAQSAFDTANTATSNITILQGVNTTQNTNISEIDITSGAAYNQANAAFTKANTVGTLSQDAFDKANSTSVLAQAAFDKANTSITADQYARDTANSAAANTIYSQGVDLTQNASISIIQGVDNTQNAEIGAIQGVDLTQNTAISIIQGVDLTQNAAISIIQSVDNTQNTNITAVSTYATSAYGHANSSFDQANVGATFVNTGGTVSGDVTITKDLSVTGNLHVLGNTTTINTSTLSVQDSMIVLGIGNYTSDLLDIGFAGHYNDGTNAHAGLIRDAVAKEFYVFQGYTPELSTSNNIDINDPSFSKANLNAQTFKGNLIGSTAVVNGLDLYDYSTSAYAKSNTVGTLAQAAFDVANNASANTVYTQGVNNTQNTNITAVNTFVGSAYDKANSANILAQASYNTANLKFDSSGGTISGNVVITGELNVTGNINFTSNVTSITGNSGQFFGDAYGFGALYAGIPVGFYQQPQTTIQATSDYNGYSQINIQNINSGNQSSGDLIITADNGAFDEGYTDVGMASSTYNYPGFGLIHPNDGYFLVYGNTTTGGGNVVVAAALNNDIVFAVNGVDHVNEILRLSHNHDATLNANLIIQGSNVALGNIENVHLYGGVAGQLLTTDGDGNISFTDSVASYAWNTANSASSNTIYAQGVNDTQNTNITAVNTFAAGAYNKANSANVLAQAAFDKANTASAASIDQYARNTANTASNNITIIQGVNTTQNTSITAVNTYAASSFGHANAAFIAANNRVLKSGDTITGSLNVNSNITSTKPNTGSLLVIGGVGVSDSLYVGNRVGFSNTSNVSMVYQYYNAATNSLDTVFG
jgi:cytoskeletal protein CcmA (bactofilin family)